VLNCGKTIAKIGKTYFTVDGRKFDEGVGEQELNYF